MKVTRFSPVTLKMNTLEIDVTEDQLDRIGGRFDTKELIQEIIPDVPAPLREFIMSGITPDEWIMLFGTDDE